MTPEERAKMAATCCGHGAEDMEVCSDCIAAAIREAVADAIGPAVNEHYFPGGIYDIGGEERTSVAFKECANPLSLELSFVTGNGVFVLVDLEPKRIMDLAEWMLAVAKGVEWARANEGTTEIER